MKPLKCECHKAQPFVHCWCVHGSPRPCPRQHPICLAFQQHNGAHYCCLDPLSTLLWLAVVQLHSLAVCVCTHASLAQHLLYGWQPSQDDHTLSVRTYC
jgi:hypothetical protein